jgi:hypothetical protein
MKLLFGLVLTLSISSVARCDPPSEPKATKTTLAVPANNPKEALRKLVTAIKAGDAAAVRSFMAVDPSNHPAYADNWAAILTSHGRLRNAVREKLGADALRQSGLENEDNRFPLDVALKEIDTARVAYREKEVVEIGPLTAARALLDYPSNFVRLRKDNHIWKVGVRDWTGLKPGDKSERLSPETLGGVMQVWGDALNRIADQLEQGKIKTMDDFSRAMRRSMGTEASPH